MSILEMLHSVNLPPHYLIMSEEQLHQCWIEGSCSVSLCTLNPIDCFASSTAASAVLFIYMCM